MKPKKANPDKSVEAVVRRNDFYRDGYQTQRFIFVVLAVSLLLSIGFNISLFKAKPEVRVVAIDTEGRVVPVISLREPIVSSSFLTNWATERATEVYTYDFRNWRKAFKDASKHFTRPGWKKFSDAMETSNNILLVEQAQMLVSSTPLGAPVIVKEGDLNGRYAWKVEFPILVTYEGSSERKTQKLMMTMVIVRVDLVTHPTGLAIEQIIPKDM